MADALHRRSRTSGRRRSWRHGQDADCTRVGISGQAVIEAILDLLDAGAQHVQTLAIPCGDEEDPKEALQRYLASAAAGHWFIIIDNADDMSVTDVAPGTPKVLLDFLPSSRTGRVLITTRSLHIASLAAGSDILELSEMTPDEAHDFLARSLVDKSQLEQVESTAELLEKLTYLPLTVAQAAAYMNVKKLPLTAYLRLCKRTSQDMINLLRIQLVRDEAHHSKTQGAVATTWIISFTAICETDAVAARLLSFIQWIQPKAIPQTILPGSETEPSLLEAIGLLCEYGFLSWREDKTLDMHDLVHLALKYWPEESHDGAMTEEDAIQHLAQVFPSDDWEERVVWRQYFPHVLPLVQENKLEESAHRADLGFWAGRCLRVDGRIREAVETLKVVEAIREKTLAEDHPSRLASRHELAGAYKANGQVKEAVALLETVVAIQEKTLAEDHPSRLASQHERVHFLPSLLLVFQLARKSK
jgi:hypothetical protein